MIQRIQTLYLLLAFGCLVGCLCVPVGAFLTDEGVRVAIMYNLQLTYAAQFVVEGMEGHSFATVSMFVVLIVAAFLSFVAVFLFRKRALQMRLCTFCMIILVGWYVLYGFFIYHLSQGLELPFRPDLGGAFPFCAIVLVYLAFRGIMKDEMLVRSLDRLR